MTTVRHPHILPPLRIEVEDDRVPEFTEAGWLLDEDASNTDHADPGADD